jgi:hypothetical protein
MMANMTNKPVTADQVQAVAEKVGIETTDEAPDDEASDDQASADPAADPAEGEEAAKLDEATAQEIADKANEIHGFTDDTPEDGDDTADAGDDTTDDTVTN